MADIDSPRATLETLDPVVGDKSSSALQHGVKTSAEASRDIITPQSMAASAGTIGDTPVSHSSGTDCEIDGRHEVAAVLADKGSDDDAGVPHGAAGIGSGSRTILWCVPRTVSTALTKCLSAVEGTQVWFEPYFYCRVSVSAAMRNLGLAVPPEYEGNEEVYQKTADLFDMICQCKANPENLSYSSIKRFLEASEGRHVFVKDMAFALNKSHFKFIPDGFTHAFLIRHPLRVFASFRRVIYAQLSHLGVLVGEAADEATFDIGRDLPYADPQSILFKELYDIWTHVRETADRPAIVIDSDDLLANPAEVVPKLCEAVGLPFDETMLQWDSSPQAAKHWVFPAVGLGERLTFAYERALTSSEFLAPSDMPDISQVTPDVIRCANDAMKYYNEMYEARFTLKNPVHLVKAKF